MVQHVLLTGANGFIGSHVLPQLSHGIPVRAVVSSQSKADQVTSDFPNHSSQLSFAIVPDITTPGAFNTAVTSSPPFDTVIHTASPFFHRAISSNREFLDPAIKGTTEVLKAVKEFAPEVKRVVITSSCAAVVDFSADPAKSPKKVYTEEDWNPTTLQAALDGTPGMAYQASKKFAETAAWEFMGTEKPDFDLVTLTPPMVYGPLRHTVKSVKDLNESNARIYNLFVNSKEDAELPPNGMPVYTDVRDLAQAHLLAATLPQASGQRFIVCAGQVGSQEICGLLRSHIPELESRTPKGIPGGNPLPENQYTCSSEKAQKVLGLTFRSKEETFVELARQMLEIEKEGE